MMRRFPGLRRLMRLDRGARGVQRAVDDEPQFHFDMTVSELRARGLDADEARREAERRFGDVARTRARLESIDRARAGQKARTEWWSGFVQDLRYTLRGLRLRPGFAAAVIVTLGLGIGANATMFGIVDLVLFRTPRYLIAPARTHRLYFNRTMDGRETFVSAESYARLRDMNRFSRTADVVGYSAGPMAIGDGDAVRELPGVAAGAGFWRFFEARPAIGRFYSAEDDRVDADGRVVVISYEFWQSEYRGTPSVLGRKLRIGRLLHTIIGVTPPGFTGLRMESSAVFLPLAPTIADRYGLESLGSFNRYNHSSLSLYAVRHDGVSLDEANADLTEAYRRSYAIQTSVTPALRRLATDHPRAVAGSIIIQRGPRMSPTTQVATWLLGVSIIVLLVACANVGNLLLGRAISRRREIAVRLALGISRRRLVAQLLLESALLAVLGAAAGLIAAQWGGALLRQALLGDMATMYQTAWGGAIADQRTLAFTMVAALGSGLLAGLAPVLHTRRPDVAAVLQSNGSRAGFAHSRVRSALLVLQAGLCVVLLVGAGLFVRSVITLRSVALGYEPDGLLWIQPSMRGEKLDSLQELALHRALLSRALSNPNVENASLVVTVPFYMTFSRDLFVSGSSKTRQVPMAILQVASPGYFATARTRIIRGRGFDTADDASSAPVAVVSNQFAHEAWGEADPIGQCLRVDTDRAPCRRVVGVAEDVRMIGDLAAAPDPMYYFPAAQFDKSDGNLYVRVRGGVSKHAEAIRRDLQLVMPGASYLNATPIYETIAPATRSWRLGATTFTVFGVLALVLAAVGLYGVVAYGVAQRTHEMGVRIALGARRRDILSLVVGDGVRLVLLGVVLGTAAALLGSRWIAPLLFNESATDTLVLTSVASAMLVVGMVASAVPALRATRVDPSIALRGD
jgi:predicted permease